MLKWINILGLMVFFSNGFADGVDVFGVDDEISAAILAQHGDEVLHFEKQLFAMRLQGMSAKKQKVFQIKKLNIEHQVAQKFHLPGVRFDTVYYPNKTLFTTINVLPSSYHEVFDETYEPQKPYDIVDKMVFFKKNAIALYIKDPKIGENLHCKDFHCIAPENSNLQDDLLYFRKMVPKQTHMIDNALFTDKHLARRRASIFLLAYYPNIPDVQIRLDRLLQEDNRFILHDTLRVYGEFLKAYPHLSVDLKRVIPLLNSYDEAIRNKTLLILDALASQEKYQHIIAKQAGDSLLKLLKLKQPNNHDIAYHILQKISHQNFGDRDYAAWQSVLQKIN
jgi:hypothetical protein